MTRAQLWERYMYFTHLECQLEREGKLTQSAEDFYERVCSILLHAGARP
jgi:hypothetical protein